MDVKGRINFPAKFREEMGNHILVAPWLDGCLIAVTENGFKDIINKCIEKEPVKARNFTRFIYSNATNVDADKQGRILLSQDLREYAILEKDIKIIGVGDHAEIWSLSKWEELKKTFNKDDMLAMLDGIR